MAQFKQLLSVMRQTSRVAADSSLSLFCDLPRYQFTKAAVAMGKAYMTTPMVRFCFWMRVCKRYRFRHPLGILGRVMFRKISIQYGMQFPHATHIGKGLFIGHPGGIVINQRATLGENCNISQGVTVGRLSRGKNSGSPRVGNRVYIGVNSVVVGNITIGDDALIGPLTLVNFDVPARAVVVGNPGKIISYQGSGEYVKHLA